MKVHLVVTQLEPAGAQKVAIDLANGLGEKGHQVTVIFFFEKVPVSYDLHANVNIHILLESGSFLNKLLGTLPKLIHFWKNNTPDVCLAFTHYANIYSAIAGKQVGIPVIVSHHNERRTYNAIVRKVDQFLQNWGYYAGIVYVSQTTGDSFSPFYRKQDNELVIYNSFESDHQFGSEAKRESEPLKILNIGRLMPQKNQQFLVQSITPDMNVELKIVGEGPEKKILEELIKINGLERKVKLLGKKNHSEILTLLDEADVFAMPSLFEGMSIALLEAIVSGVYTVVSDVPSQREAVTCEGEIFGEVLLIDSPSRWNAFFKKLSQAKPGKLRGSDLHTKLVSRYSKEKFVEKYEQLFQSVAS
jgi:glycosyltransferase involved in cell wall biosynthesis